MSRTITEPNILAFVFPVGFPNSSAFILVVTKPGRKCCWLEAPFVKPQKIWQNNLTFRLFNCSLSNHFPSFTVCTLYRLYTGFSIKYVLEIFHLAWKVIRVQISIFVQPVWFFPSLTLYSTRLSLLSPLGSEANGFQRFSRPLCQAAPSTWSLQGPGILITTCSSFYGPPLFFFYLEFIFYSAPANILFTAP